jgi:hypothetical protein
LSSEVKNASSSIPAYDQRTYSDAIKALSTKLQDVRTKVAPRPKFSFKSSTFTARKNESAISLNDAAELANQKRRQIPGYVSDTSGASSFATTPAGPRSPAPELANDDAQQSVAGITSKSAETAHLRGLSLSQSTSVNINNHKLQHIILPPSAAHATSSGTLSNLRRCVIDLSSPTSDGPASAGMTLKNIKESLIICGQVNGAIHLTNVTDSVIVVACRQFRMHESRGCDVYLQASGRPIIEHCTNIRFAPLPEKFVRDASRTVEDQWQAVDDFNWLKSEPSPNWKVVDESDRITSRTWNTVVPGGPGIGTADILKAVGINI